MPFSSFRICSQSKFLEISCNLLKVQEKSRVIGLIGFSFASHFFLF